MPQRSSSSPVPDPEILIAPSKPQLASFLPSGLVRSACTRPWCPAIARTHSPRPISHQRSTPSRPALTSKSVRAPQATGPAMPPSAAIACRAPAGGIPDEQLAGCAVAAVRRHQRAIRAPGHARHPLHHARRAAGGRSAVGSVPDRDDAPIARRRPVAVPSRAPGHMAGDEARRGLPQPEMGPVAISNMHTSRDVPAGQPLPVGAPGQAIEPHAAAIGVL